MYESNNYKVRSKDMASVCNEWKCTATYCYRSWHEVIRGRYMLSGGRQLLTKTRPCPIYVVWWIRSIRIQVWPSKYAKIYFRTLLGKFTMLPHTPSHWRGDTTPYSAPQFSRLRRSQLNLVGALPPNIFLWNCPWKLCSFRILGNVVNMTTIFHAA